MKAKSLRVFLLFMVLVLAISTPVLAFTLEEVGGTATCDGFTGWGATSQDAFFEWTAELFEVGNATAVETQIGPRTAVASPRIDFSGTWGLNPMCGDYTVRVTVSAFNFFGEPRGTKTWETSTPLHCDCPSGGEGCTPGYWKNHLEDWPPTGYSTGQDFDTVFSVDLFDPNITLGEAISAKGGGDNKLARHGTAALLSAVHPAVAYPFTEAEVIAMVQGGNADTLVEANELGCDIP